MHFFLKIEVTKLKFLFVVIRFENRACLNFSKKLKKKQHGSKK